MTFALTAPAVAYPAGHQTLQLERQPKTRGLGRDRGRPGILTGPEHIAEDGQEQQVSCARSDVADFRLHRRDSLSREPYRCPDVARVPSPTRDHRAACEGRGEVSGQLDRGFSCYFRVSIL